MSILDELVYWSNLLVIGIALIAGIVAFMIFYFTKIRKPKKEAENDELYSTFDRKNSISYVPFDDIQDGMILMDGETRFVAAVTCKGFDFYSADIAEQFSTLRGYTSFVNTIDRPITKRMTSKAVDLDIPLANHRNIIENISLKLVALYDKYTETAKNLKLAGENERELYLKELSNIENEIKNTEWQCEHTKHVYSYLDSMSNEEAAPIREEAYIFDWTYNPQDFPEEMTDADIRKRANSELESKVNQMQHSLSQCNVRIKRADDTTLREMNRRHFQPYGADLYRKTDVDNSNFSEMVVTSKSLEEAEKRYDEMVNDALLQALLDTEGVSIA